MKFKKIVVAGGGSRGSQIAYQIAYRGFQVVIEDVDATAIAATKRRLAQLNLDYAHQFNATPAVIFDTNARIDFATDLETAVEDADLIIEALPEVAATKNIFYTELAQVAPEQAIIATNSATMLPSRFAAITGRPAKFLAMHFADHLCTHGLAEVMGHAGTDAAVFRHACHFVRQIGLVPIAIHRETPGYVLTSLLLPFVNTALTLWLHDVADPQTIDRAWMIATQSPMGPFGMLDEIGLRQVYHLLLAAGREPGKGDLVDVAHKLKRELLDHDKFGEENRQGFYTYPAPAFTTAKFLTAG
ncbi:MAG: 3-hydroxyacyl-CoA dehydrogenase [Levilactobacillus sp.]|jgi:3-hydroxybutyryl-CoA dehydrogenase|uniref:3-hydroxyacyl-CoA dehydrogenase n=1 Tax=Levilactobacillus sp. TaxID=2767919 RepID=UPI002584336B|nr:3-hydroxyacyl-CoA dehydrogenase [Levilactobacillus sp.]MCH4124092.1 3-hydroxyacyl-CoA dehydrogenase [Levilactobacillus sp.]MCI1554072.1 3-hydroxyacyl-CoA dehydrogenase [Levilactobacillus sp.]MCI1598464.1 3-hydroxyacyl-CoA dehydrogenase [Levilactobacillus sp.]